MDISDNNKTTIHIACAIDDAFRYPLGVTLQSIFTSNKHNRIKIHLFSATCSDATIAMFEKLCISNKQLFRYYLLKETLFEDLPHNDRISLASYYRLLTAGLIEEEVRQYIYLDADTIVRTDLAPLFNTDLGPFIIGAVNDVAAIDMNIHIKHGIPDSNLYFNAGVLLIDRLKWIENDTTRQVLEYIKTNKEKCTFWDQDGLNAILYKHCLHLHPKWNQQIAMFYCSKSAMDKAYPMGYADALSNPCIVHYNGSEKPWDSFSAHPFARDFKKNASQISFFDLPKSKKPFMKQLKRHLAYRILGWKNINRYIYNKFKQIRLEQEKQS